MPCVSMHAPAPHLAWVWPSSQSQEPYLERGSGSVLLRCTAALCCCSVYCTALHRTFQAGMTRKEMPVGEHQSKAANWPPIAPIAPCCEVPAVVKQPPVAPCCKVGVRQRRLCPFSCALATPTEPPTAQGDINECST